MPSRLPLTTVLMQLPRMALDLLFPLTCLGCRREGDLLCPDCAADLPRLKTPYCRICAEPNVRALCRWCSGIAPAFDGLRAPYLMEGCIREAVHALKYRGVRAAAPQLAELLADFLESHSIPGEEFVPVNLHSRRLRERGYNQSELLAKELSKRTGLPTNAGVLMRIKDSGPQVRTASREQRRENVSGSFQCKGDMTGRRLILIDDVATTGSTLSACAAALKAAGAASVWALVLAREG